MFAARLVNLIETHADNLSQGLMDKLLNSGKCDDLLHKVPKEELRKRAHEIYRNLSDWLLTKTESEVEERYIGLGMRRAHQGVPFSHFLWAINTTKDYLWEFLQREGLFEEPIELFGEIELLHSLERFFDQVLYYAAIGYESARASEHLHAMPRVATGGR
jgi:hypothetical protein